MSKHNKRDDFDNDRVIEHAQKVNFKQYLQDLEEESLVEDDSSEIIPASHVNLRPDFLVEIDFSYNNDDAKLLLTKEAVEDFIAMSAGTSFDLPDNGTGINWYVEKHADGFISFDSGIHGTFGRVSCDVLSKKSDAKNYNQ